MVVLGTVATRLMFQLNIYIFQPFTALTRTVSEREENHKKRVLVRFVLQIFPLFLALLCPSQWMKFSGKNFKQTLLVHDFLFVFPALQGYSDDYIQTMGIHSGPFWILQKSSFILIVRCNFIILIISHRARGSNTHLGNTQTHSRNQMAPRE